MAYRGSPEKKVRDAIRDMLQGRGWRVHIMHGNAFQKGIPDLYIMHPRDGTRWVDCKVAGRYNFTNAQKKTWPSWHFDFNVGIWILTDGTSDQYDRLFAAPNWLDYWRPSWGDPRSYIRDLDVDELLKDHEA